MKTHCARAYVISFEDLQYLIKDFEVKYFLKKYQIQWKETYNRFECML